MKRATIFASVLAVAVTLTACAGSQPAEDTSASYNDPNYLAPVQTAPELRIKDLPVPAGYAYRADRSMIIQYSDVTAGILTYEGSVPVGELISFYQREMPRFDWSMTSMVEREETEMIFQKEGRICRLMLKAAGGLGKKTIVSVYYTPKQ